MGNKNWLPHLTNEMMIGARNNNFCSYLIALEGWRRGLTVKYYSEKVRKKGVHTPGLLFSLSSDNEKHVFYKSRGDKIKGKAISIGSNKYETKKWLSENGIPVAEGKKFTRDVENTEIINYAKNIGFPVVLKPVVGAMGRGVIANIRSEDFLEKSLLHVRNELNHSEVVVERYVPGEEYRVFVVKNEVIAVLNRIPANVTGDGIHSISQLIALKNKERRKNPRLYNCLIKVDYEVKSILQMNGIGLDTIPKENETLFLRAKSNISTGGDSVEVTDQFPIEFKKTAINALKSIPGFPHGGIDIIVDLEKPIKKTGIVLELSPTPQIGSLVFPMKGKGRDVPSAIIDYYFPETKDKRNNNPNVYFNLKDTLAPLMSKSASEVTVTPAPPDLTFAKKYIVTGKVQGVGFRRWVRKKALESDLYGYAQNQNDGSLVIVVAGTEPAVNKFKQTCEQGPKVSEVSGVTEKTWDHPIKVGFEIKKTPIRKKQTKQLQNEKQTVTTAQKLKK